MDYRRRDVVLAGVAATFVLANLAQFVSDWLAWLVPIGVAAACGAVIAEGNDGAGAGALAAGGGGFLFAFGNLANLYVRPVVADGAPGDLLQDALVYSTVQSVNLFALFGLAGMLAGGVAGLAAARARMDAEGDDDAGGEETAARSEQGADGSAEDPPERRP